MENSNNLQSNNQTALTPNPTTGGPASSNPKENSVKGMNNLLDALMFKGLINQAQYNEIKFEALNNHKSVENVINEKKILEPEAVVRVLAEMRNINFVDLDNIVIAPEVLNLIPGNIAKAKLAVAFEEVNNKLKVAMKDPLDLQAVQYLESIAKKRIEAFYATEADINKTIDTKYGAQIGSEVDQALEEAHDSNALTLGKDEGMVSAGGSTNTSDSDSNAPIIRIVNMILDYGVKNKASDIHIEPREGKVVVRFRIRGFLTEKLTIPRKLLSAVVTRIKILSDLKIDEHRIPQDGRFQVKTKESVVDIRVSIIPSIYGEKIVMRILEKTQGVMDLEDTGLRGVSYSRLKEAISKTQGIILVTGPTGSGKTQTLASCLKILNKPEVNIITLEDPVEIRVEGVNQVQVNAEVGLTFANGLRAILRQDPDIVMVGEIRDGETAGLAVQSALVGRLVLSTLHTNSSAGAFVRLIDMGIEPFLLSSTVNIVVAQRLIRVLCDCKKPYKAPETALKQIHEELDVLNGITLYTPDKQVKLKFDKNTTDITLYEPVGCPKCNDTGFKSRLGIFEALKISEKISRLVMEKVSINEIQKIAIQEGMITMVQDGFIKALEGITTLEEVLRVKNE